MAAMKWSGAAVLAMGAMILAGCQTRELVIQPTSEQRLPLEQLDFIKLKPWLPGKSRQAVFKRLGQPNQVYDRRGRENWLYVNAAYDPPSGRAVNYLRLEFDETGRVSRSEYTMAPPLW